MIRKWTVDNHFTINATKEEIETYLNVCKKMNLVDRHHIFESKDGLIFEVSRIPEKSIINFKRKVTIPNV